MSRHIDAPTLSACREGLLRRWRAARVRRHLAACTACAELDERLARVPTLLANTPAPPLPAAVAARLDAALADEVARRATAPAPAPPAPQQARRSAARARPHRPAVLRLAAAAAMVVVVAGGAYGLTRLASGSTGASSAGGAGTAAGLQPGALLAGVPVVHSGTDYRPTRQAAQIRAVVTSQPLTSQPVTGQPNSSQQSGRPRWSSASAALAGCALRVTGGRRPLVVDVARYRGRPADLVVVKQGERSLRVWAVRPGCAGPRNGVIASFTVPITGH